MIQSVWHGLGEFGDDELFEPHDVSGKFSDSFGCLLGGHRVVVQLQAERFFIERHFVER